MALLTKIGYGQVEPNHLSAQRTAQIYAQLPAESTITTLENGQFVKYDYAAGEVNFTGAGEWMLVYNEIKVYGPRETDKDYVMSKDNYIEEVMTPRVFKTNVGDIFTTNLVEITDDDGETIAKGAKLTVGATGILEETADVSAADMVWQVAKVYTMPDRQLGLKVQRIK